jgi:hypothetical protein
MTKREMRYTTDRVSTQTNKQTIERARVPSARRRQHHRHRHRRRRRHRVTHAWMRTESDSVAVVPGRPLFSLKSYHNGRVVLYTVD